MLVINCGSSSLKYTFYDTRRTSRATRADQWSASVSKEIAMTEGFKLDVADTPGCTLEGAACSVKLGRGVISAFRQIISRRRTRSGTACATSRSCACVWPGTASSALATCSSTWTRTLPSPCTSTPMRPTPRTGRRGRREGYIEGIQSEA
jgi:hypothetical protein